MDHKCEIETFYYPEKSNTSEDLHIPVSIMVSVRKLEGVNLQPSRFPVSVQDENWPGFTKRQDIEPKTGQAKLNVHSLH